MKNVKNIKEIKDNEILYVKLPKKEFEELLERLKNCESNNKKLKEAVKFLNEEIDKINNF
jgi:uncharacterized protein (DUF1778 family)